MSTSSSDCECCEYNETYSPIQPLYPDLGQPLVYFAQVQRKQRNQRNEKVKNNCFVKAFRWYTQEHVPLSQKESITNYQDLQSFAAWLDEKYEQYLRSNQHGNEVSQSILEQNAKTNGPSINVSRKQLIPRRHKLKSPWRRRLKSLNKQNGDSILKMDKSIEIILKPKNLSRSTSECCQKCHHSNHTITIDIHTPPNPKSKSESIVYVLNDQEMYTVASDDKTTLEKKILSHDEINENKGHTEMKKGLANNVSCQCSNFIFEKVDASSQFSHTKDRSIVCECVKTNTAVSNRAMNFVANCPCIESKALLQSLSQEKPHLLLQTVGSSPISQKTLPVPASDTHVVMESRKTSLSAKTNIEKNRPSLPVNKIAQTSDHAINLDEAIHQGHPIFFRVICADKLH